MAKSKFVEVGASRARVIADTVSSRGDRITSVEVTYPRIVLPELNTHRLLTRSTASSRAVPFARRKEQIENAPFVPTEFGVNRPGMQAHENLPRDKHEQARKVWLAAAKDAVLHADELARLGVHKQVVNRLLEPFTMVTTIVTATEWSNFFALRIPRDAQPEMRDLATAVKQAIDASEPRTGVNHAPYHDPTGAGIDETQLPVLMASSARCARVSFRSHKTGKTPTVEEDENLAARLLSAKHMSPFDHPAIPYSTVSGAFSESECRQYVGWIPFRVVVERQLGMKCSKIPDRRG